VGFKFKNKNSPPIGVSAFLNFNFMNVKKFIGIHLGGYKF